MFGREILMAIDNNCHHQLTTRIELLYKSVVIRISRCPIHEMC